MDSPAPQFADARRHFSNALRHALTMEIDGGIFAALGGTDMRAYAANCRRLLLELYGVVPYPFDDDNYWDR